MYRNSKSGRFVSRIIIAALLGGATMLAGSTPASAHASVQMYGETAKSGGYGAIFLRIPHAAAGLSTNIVEVQIPEGVTSVKPQRISGWTEKVVFAADGKTATSVIWSGGDLPDTAFQDFGLQVKFPATPGATLYFKTVQTLSDGSLASWIEIPAAGVDGHTLAKPAPTVTLAAAPATGHGTPATGHGTPATGHETPAAGTHTMPAKPAGEMAVKLSGKSAKIIADTSALNGGASVTLRLIEGTRKTTVLAAKLDAHGDLIRTISAKSTGKKPYRLDAGDRVELLLGNKVIAEATI
jgi:uncharacterized protein YcnI